MIIGVAGACRKAELTNMRVRDVVDEGTFFKITIPNTKTNVIREFVIVNGNISGYQENLVDIIRKYVNLRPQIGKHDRFFVKYNNDKCGVQPVGINILGCLPKVIAQYLGLPNATGYTGHCFRRSSASLLADSGADILKIKQHGGWKSSTVAEGYVENSLANKKRIASNILGEHSEVAVSGEANPSGSMHDVQSVHSGVAIAKKEINLPAGSALTFNDCACSNFVVNVYTDKSVK